MHRFRSYVPAGVLVPLFVLAVATLGAAGVSTASGDTPTPSASPTPTPSASPTPTPSASPTPYPQSTVSVRFHDGGGREDVPAVLGLAEPITSLTADGVDCTPEHSGQYTEASGYSTEWPRRGPGLPAECTKGPPTALRFEFTSSYLGETLIWTIVLEGTWTGGDLDLLHDASARPAPDASPSPSTSQEPTAASLPKSGGVAADGSGEGGVLALASLSLVAIALAAFWFSVKSRG